MSRFNFFDTMSDGYSKVPTKVSSRTLRSAIEEVLMTYTRLSLETVLAEELELPWTKTDHQPNDDNYSKREVIQAYTEG